MIYCHQKYNEHQSSIGSPKILGEGISIYSLNADKCFNNLIVIWKNDIFEGQWKYLFCHYQSVFWIYDSLWT